MSKQQRRLSLAAPITLAAAAASGDGLPRFDMVAYTGGVVKPMGWWDGVVVDLAGLEIASQEIPIRFAHRSGWADGIGHTDRIAVENGQLSASGVVSRDTLTAREVVTSARNGFPWQASIGADVLEIEFLREGVTTTVNGQQVTGPLEIARKSRLYEISVVDLGADPNTETNIAASASQQGGGAMAGENDQVQAPAASQPAQTPATPATPAVQAVQDEGIAAIRAAQAAEIERIAAVRRIAAGNAEIEARAVREGWDTNRTELEVLRANRPSANVVMGGQPAATSRVLEAALAQATRLDKPERHFDEATLQAAHTRFRGRISLQEVLLEAAWANGYLGRSFRQDPRGVLQAAFSSRDISGILSNTANKFLLQGFMGVEQAWREIASTRPVSDFKTTTSYRLTGSEQYEMVAPDGEIKHGTLGELAYTNKADTYGKILSITRQDMVNDDLNALSGVPMRLGRGAGLKLNDVFWTVFLNNSSFFTTGNANYISGATAGDTTDSRLNVDGLTRAERTFLDQTDTDGKPLGVRPRVLLHPTRLKVPAWQLNNSTEIRDTTASTKAPIGNPFAGMFRPVTSTYLGNSNYTGYSTLAWYLLADPMDLSVIEVVFLNGQESPTIETADADFNTLGIQMRGYHDFGVALQEYRAGVKAKGEA